MTVRRIATTTAPQRHLNILKKWDLFFILYIRWDLTCERQQSTRGRPTCDCQKGTRCLLPYTARTQILWPDNAKQTHTRQESKPGGSRELMWWIQQKKLCVMKYSSSSSSLMSSPHSLAWCVWQTWCGSLWGNSWVCRWRCQSDPGVSTCHRSPQSAAGLGAAGEKTHRSKQHKNMQPAYVGNWTCWGIKYWFSQQQFFPACTGSCFVCWETFSTI